MNLIDDETYVSIVQTAYSNDKTRANYLARLSKLRSVCNNASYYDILSKPNEFYPIIHAKYENISTRKNMLTTILVLFKHCDELRASLVEQHKRWKKFHDDMDSFQEAQYKKNLPNPDQLSKYTSFDEMDKKYKELKNGPDPHDTRQNSQRLVLLSILTSIPPKRADYSKIKVYYDTDPNKQNENYMVLRRNTKHPSYLVFTVYKTSEDYKRIDEVLPLMVFKDVMDSLRRHPRDYLFVNRYGDPFASNNAFSKYVIQMFVAFFGRATGTTMLRHIYITEKVDFNELNDEELEEISKQMMHSTKLQRKYNWSKKGICDNYRRICGDCQDKDKKPTNALSK